MERWLPLEGYPQYAISDHGRVVSLKRARRLILKPALDRYGYERVSLYDCAGNGRPRYVHQLVLLAFVGAPNPGQHVRHLNGNSLDNRLANLTYGTRSENQLDTVRHGTHNNAAKEECPHGHSYTPENTKLYQGRRYCRACHRIDNQRRRDRAKHGAH
jgi:hypothetical protein